MGYTYNFFDNQIIGAEDLNNLAKRFVTEGVADIFKNGLPHNISNLNSIVTANATEGVVPDTDNSLKVYVSGSNILISPGTAFFPDGTTMTVDSDGITLPYTKGTSQYVYLISDRSTNSCFAMTSRDVRVGNLLVLAKVETDGTVTDKRQYAKGKIPSAYASTTGLITKKKLTWTPAEIQNLTAKEIPISSGRAKGLFTHTHETDSKMNTFGFATFNSNGEAELYISGCLFGSVAGYKTNPTFSTSELILQNANDLHIALRASAHFTDGKVVIQPTASAYEYAQYVNTDFYVF